MHQKRLVEPLLLTHTEAMTTFIMQALLNFKSVGSLVPSSAALCGVLAQPVMQLTHANVLEVGSGDGVIARYLLSHYKEQIRELWVNERNAALFTLCKKHLETTELAHTELFLKEGAFEDIPFPTQHFDMIISSLPLNSLPHDQVICILERFKLLLKASPQATFCFYEYLGSRLLNTLHSMLSTEATLSSALSKTFEGYTFSSQLVLQNFPPARVWKIQRAL